jgi:hypothetical protein
MSLFAEKKGRSKCLHIICTEATFIPCHRVVTLQTTERQAVHLLLCK